MCVQGENPRYLSTATKFAVGRALHVAEHIAAGDRRDVMFTKVGTGRIVVQRSMILFFRYDKVLHRLYVHAWSGEYSHDIHDYAVSSRYETNEHQGQVDIGQRSGCNRFTAVPTATCCCLLLAMPFLA